MFGISRRSHPFRVGFYVVNQIKDRNQMASKRATRTKTETAAEVHQVRAKARSNSSFGQHELTELSDKVKEAMEKAGGIRIEQALQKLTQAGIEISRTISTAQQQLTSELAELETVRTAREAYAKELEDLFGKDILSSHLRDIAEEHEQKMNSLAEQLQAAIIEHERQLAELNRRYNDSYTELERNRKRDADDYVFRLSQARRDEEAKYKEQQDRQRIQDNLRREAAERELTERFKEVGKAEEELAILRQKVADMPAVIEKTASEQTAKAVNAVKRDLQYEFSIKQKDLESALSLAKAANETLIKQMSAVENRNMDLQRQLSEALGKNTEIARAALEASSGRQALESVTAFASTTNQAQPTSRR
jgi:colicin import membrane protein